MLIIRWIIAVIFILNIQAFCLDGYINAQFSLADAENGTLQGYYNVTFEIHSSTENISEADPLWSESHNIFITEGQLIKTLGIDSELIYHIFKNSALFIRLVFDNDTNDSVYVPLISVPSSIYAQYSDYAREIEYTESWMKISTPDHRVGIGITQDLTVEFQVADTDDDGYGVIYSNIVTADAMYSTDGYGIHNLDYAKMVEIDDYSLHPDDGDGIPNDSPDVLYINSDADIGIGFLDATENIEATFHVSGDIKIDYGKLYGDDANIELVGTSNTAVSFSDSENEGPQFIWDSTKSFFRAGYVSGINTNISSNFGDYVAVFGRDNAVEGDYSFSSGADNSVESDYSVIFGGSNSILSSALYSGIFSGFDNQIQDSTHVSGYSIIGGGSGHSINGQYSGVFSGYQNSLTSSYSSILGGAYNAMSNSEHSTILGGQYNTIENSDYSIVGGYRASVASGDDGVFIFSGRDEDNNDDPLIESSNSSQFLVYALNGVGFGTNSFTDVQSVDFPDAYSDAIDLKAHSIRTVGDIVAMADDTDGTLGYLIGDGRYITNIQSLWNSNESDSNSPSKVIFTETHLVGIGVGSDDSYLPEAFLHIKDKNDDVVQDFDLFKAFKIESVDDNYLTVHVDSDGISEFNVNHAYDFQYDENTVLYMSDTIVSVNRTLFVDSGSDTGYSLEVSGDVDITGTLEVDSAEFSGDVMANTFTGDGSNLTDVQANYLSNRTQTFFQQLYVGDDGNIGVGTVTDNIQQLLHIGDETGEPQLRLQDDTVSSYTTFQSTTQLATVFYGFTADDQVIYSIGSNDGLGSSSSTLLQVSAIGNVSMGDVAPDGSNRLTVDGDVSANAYIGNGAAITDEQLDVPQENAVTFEERVTLDDVIKLTPGDGMTCTADDVGVIFAYNDGSTATICACVGDGESKPIVYSDSGSGSCE